MCAAWLALPGYSKMRGGAIKPTSVVGAFQAASARGCTNKRKAERSSNRTNNRTNSRMNKTI